MDIDKPTSLVALSFKSDEAYFDTAELAEQYEDIPQAEKSITPVDIHYIIEIATEALEDVGEDKGWMLERRQVRNAIIEIHRLLNPNVDSDKILLPHLAKDHVRMLSLLAQLHTKYANKMTPKGKDGVGVFIQYNDMSHAAPRDYGGTSDSNYSMLQHYSRKEIADRSFAIKLAQRLIDSGYEDAALEESIATNMWILGERLTGDIWDTDYAQAWLCDTYSEAHSVVDRYLPADSHEQFRYTVGSRAVANVVKVELEQCG